MDFAKRVVLGAHKFGRLVEYTFKGKDTPTRNPQNTNKLRQNDVSKRLSLGIAINV